MSQSGLDFGLGVSYFSGESFIKKISCSFPTRERNQGHSGLTQSAFNVVLRRSIYTQIRELILHPSNSKGYVDAFVGELTSAKRLEKHFA